MTRRAQTIIVILACFLLGFSSARAQDTPADARVKAGVSLRLRDAPSLDGAVLTLLQTATALTILSLSADRQWLQVTLSDGQVGWVFADYVDVLIDLNVEFPDGSGYARLPQVVVAHIQQVYAEGQQHGNRANVFAKVGDSITVSTLMLHPVGDGIYNLGEYTYLQNVIDFYASAETRDGHNSFNDDSLAARIGWTTYLVLNADESDRAVCLPGEVPLLCEYRVLRPALSLIMLGTNDVSVLLPENYRANLSRIVSLTLGEDIIPILSTIPTRPGYEDRVQQFNAIIRDVAQQNAIPLLDYGAAMQPLGRGGLDEDGVHPSVPPKGYEGAADFRPPNLQYGYVIRNLTALQMLDAIYRHTAGAS